MGGTLKIVLFSVLFFIIGGAIAGITMWGIQRVKIAELEKERDNAILEKVTMKKQWEEAVNELNKTRIVLNDTYAALELLKKYQLVNKDIQKDIDSIDDTLDPDGNTTEETYQAFRDMMEEFNQLQGNIPTASNGEELGILNLQPFVELREEAEGLFKHVTDMILEYK